ncbi:MAG: tetratricopeptide repeat protein [Sulfurimonas sp.]|jgi:TPR repeat protein
MKKIFVVLIFITSSVFAISPEENIEASKEDKFLWLKQRIKCEIVVKTGNGDAKECIKSADMILALKGKKLDANDIPKNIEEKAAESFHNAGVIYTDRLDYKNAIIMYEKAAKLKLPSALNNLGYIYAHGLGVPENYTKAFKYWKEASALGNENAQQSLQALCSKNSWACK